MLFGINNQFGSAYRTFGRPLMANLEILREGGDGVFR